MDSGVELVRNQPEQTYRAHPALNQSSLKKILESPQAYWDAIHNPMKTTPAMTVGSALHTLLLQGRFEFEVEWFVLDEGLTGHSKAYKDAKKAEKETGMRVLTHPQYELVEQMFHAMKPTVWFNVPEDDVVRFSNYRRQNELTFYWRWHGQDCKARIDRLIEFPDKILVIDVKTTYDCSPDSFPSSVIKFGYDFQERYYTYPVEQYFKKPVEFLFVVVERGTGKFQTYYTDVKMKEEAKKQVDFALQEVARCTEEQDWGRLLAPARELTYPHDYVSPLKIHDNSTPYDPLDAWFD